MALNLSNIPQDGSRSLKVAKLKFVKIHKFRKRLQAIIPNTEDANYDLILVFSFDPQRIICHHALKKAAKFSYSDFSQISLKKIIKSSC